MIAFLVGCIIGFVLAMPPGPVAITVMSSVIKGSYRQGLWAAGAASISDGFIAVGVLFASSAIVEAIRALIADHPTIALVGEIALISLLVVYGIRLARIGVRSRPIEVSRLIEQPLKRTILAATVTAYANLFNPTFLPSLAATFTAALPVMAPGGDLTTYHKLLAAIGFAVGTFLWLLILVSVVARHCERFSFRQLLLLRRTGAAIVLFFAGILLWHVAIH